ncbi:FAD dependent oxidoreductase [Streptomyces davaonensis JCM 4913]|uniref:FAD dependent oxidoreductase n=1 Tax=Streptomyces davaonensis (strain DSM 101723 / JCM 4913 / KCC S-0913 / 768) TaxID=1214101 RepID=K4QWZ0_STRDJ|nr:FAD-dependent oxidoreductase [Streptomyces davaonensis]CCK28606.1 FAD dependent oxidoreductase [Streptomyces davaonensis JCM 4913]
MSIAVIGGGIAGAALAWRLRLLDPASDITLFVGHHSVRGDATGASGGMVRGFETDAESCVAATESLAELVASPVLRDWADYREVGSHYVLEPGDVDVAALASIVEAGLPGSLTWSAVEDLSEPCPLRGLPQGAVAVVERQGGYFSPHRLRTSITSELLRSRVVVSQEPVTGVRPDGTLQGVDRVHAGGFRAVVVAAGAWTPHLLLDRDPAADGFRTKAIQYVRCPVAPPGLGAFTDETSGLYGRPLADGGFLLGVPTQRWGVDPDGVGVDPSLIGTLLDVVAERLGLTLNPSGLEGFGSADCYHREPGLALRDLERASPVYTFTGGSGGAAKTVLAASRTAAARLLDRVATGHAGGSQAQR